VLSTPPPSQIYSHFPVHELHSSAKIRYAPMTFAPSGL
jgi:hypothetical protein